MAIFKKLRFHNEIFFEFVAGVGSRFYDECAMKHILRQNVSNNASPTCGNERPVFYWPKGTYD